jgi:peptidoglycan/xylan/chitin deacetylase (PgdA/CDA1 family)
METVDITQIPDNSEQLSTWETIEKTVTEAVPLSLYRLLVRRDVVGLVYHAISPTPLTHLKHIYPVKTPAAFEHDLIYLRDHYHIITYDQLLAHNQDGVRLEPNAALITFDDGYRECFTEVRPLLKKYGLPAVFFLTTDLLDNRHMFYRNKYSLAVARVLALAEPELAAILPAFNRQASSPLPDRPALLRWLRSLNYLDEAVMDKACYLLGLDPADYLATDRPYLTTEEVKILAADGFTIGAHGRRHSKLDLLQPSERAAEILGSCQSIQAITGQTTVPFAFPFSGYGVDRRALADLRAEHRVIGLLFDSKGMRMDRPFIYNRVWADPPPAPDAGRSNLVELIQAAYQENARWRYRYLFNVLRARWGGTSAK